MPERARKDPWAIEFGAFVQRLRKAQHWTIAELARRTDRSPAWVSILEKGGNMPSVAMLLWLAHAFGMRASELLRRFEDERSEREAAARAQSAE